MLEPDFSIRDTFPSVGYAQWRALAEASLRGAPFEEELVTQTYEEINLQPVYTRENFSADDDAVGFPGFPPFVRGSQALGAAATGWDLRQEHSSPLPTAVNEDILADVQGGATSLLLVLDRTACHGLDPDEENAADLTGRAGMMVYHVDDLDAALANVDLSKVGVALDAGAAYLPASALLMALWQRRGLAAKDVCGAFNADPLGVLAREGRLPYLMDAAFDQLSNLASWTSQNYPQVTAVGVDTSSYHDAGATATQDLAFALATGVQYLRAMTDLGMAIDVAVKQTLFRFSLDSHFFLSIAKLRAGRRLWERVVEACGGAPESASMRIHAQLGNRVLTRIDPQMNLLRNTFSVFAAGLGGADAITSVPFDDAIGSTDAFSRRVARNTALILQEEAHIHRVVDPSGGSWYLESLTDQLAEKAWDIFQEVERLGGMFKALESGWVAEQIERSCASRAQDIATGKAHIIGVTEFPNPEEKRVTPPTPNWQQLRADVIRRLSSSRNSTDTLTSLASASALAAEAVKAATKGASLGQLADALGFHRESTTVAPLEAHRDAGGSEHAMEGVSTP